MKTKLIYYLYLDYQLLQPWQTMEWKIIFKYNCLHSPSFMLQLLICQSFRLCGYLFKTRCEKCTEHLSPHPLYIFLCEAVVLSLFINPNSWQRLSELLLLLWASDKENSAEIVFATYWINFPWHEKYIGPYTFLKLQPCVQTVIWRWGKAALRFWSKSRNFLCVHKYMHIFTFLFAISYLVKRAY